jgi:hypothetical protein
MIRGSGNLRGERRTRSPLACAPDLRVHGFPASERRIIAPAGASWIDRTRSAHDDDGERKHGERCAASNAAAGTIENSVEHAADRIAGPRSANANDRIADRDRRIRAPAGGDDDVLAALPLVGHRRRDAGRRQPAGPQLGTGLRVERAQVTVQCSADEDDAAAGHERAAEVRRAPARRESQRRDVFERAEVGLPQDALRAQVERREHAPWRRVARQLPRREQQLALHAERRASLRGDLDAREFLAHLAEFGRRKQRDHVHQSAGVRVDDVACGIDRDPTPVDAAAGEREEDRSFLARRRVEAFVARGGNPLAAFAAIPERQSPGVVGRERRGREQRQIGRKRLRRRKRFARRAALRHRALLDRKDRRAGIAVQDEQHPLLGARDYDVSRLARRASASRA